MVKTISARIRFLTPEDGGRLEPARDGIRELGIVAQTFGEGDVGQPEVVLAEEFAEGAQALELGGAVHAVATGGARGGEQPDAFEIAEHAGRPAGGRGRFLNGERLHP